MTTARDARGLLTRTHDLLGEIETVLAHTSPATQQEITTILARYAGNQGGFGMLIDMVQFTARDIQLHLNSR